MAAMRSSATLSRLKVRDVRQIATGLEINHRENGIRLKKNNLIKKSTQAKRFQRQELCR